MLLAIMRILRLPLVVLILASCASQTRLPARVRIELGARHAGRTVELRQSCYYGDLYDENERWLLSPHPFDSIHHIVDTDGAPIQPKGQRGIAPAGSRFVIQQVEFPDGAAVATRMLTTPRYHPWIYLQPDAQGSLPNERDVFILLLPMDLDSESAVEEALGRLLAPKDEVRQWLSKRTPTVRVAIEHKDMIEGMSRDELVAAMGEPQDWFKEQQGGSVVNVAWYTHKEAWLQAGVVREVRRGRKRGAGALPSKEPPAGPGEDQGQTGPEDLPGVKGSATFR